MTSTPAPAGFAALFEHHSEAVFRAALRVTGNPADAEDVLQTVFLRVLSRSAQDEATGRPAAYFSIWRTIASVNSVVVALPPRSLVRIPWSWRTWSSAVSMRSAVSCMSR